MNYTRSRLGLEPVASYLSNGTQSSPKTQDTKQIREQETKSLESFISDKALWISDIDFSQYVSEGAEQRVLTDNCPNLSFHPLPNCSSPNHRDADKPANIQLGISVFGDFTFISFSVFGVVYSAVLPYIMPFEYETC